MAGKINKSELARKLSISRSSLYYESKMDKKDKMLKERIEEVLASIRIMAISGLLLSFA